MCQTPLSMIGQAAAARHFMQRGVIGFGDAAGAGSGVTVDANVRVVTQHAPVWWQLYEDAWSRLCGVD
jgi:hypothetical protein